MAAVDRAGGWQELAGCLGVRTSALRRWRKQGAMPERHARAIERAYGVRIRSNREGVHGFELFDEARRVGLGVYRLRRIVGINDTMLRRWVRDGRIPPRRAKEIERIIKKWVDIRNRK